MKTKSLFLSMLMMLFALSYAMATTNTDDISLSELEDGGYMIDSGDLNEISNISSSEISGITSSATYSGWLGYSVEAGDAVLYLDNNSIFGSATSAGKLVAVTINWNTDWVTAGDKLYLFGTSLSTPDVDFAEDVYSSISASASYSLIGEIIYDGSVSTVIDNIEDAGSFYNFVLVAEAYEIYFSGIEVEWSSIVTYDVTVPDSVTAKATVTTDAGNYEVGAYVTATITPKVQTGKKYYELRGYQIGDNDYVDLGVANYTSSAYTLPRFRMVEGGITLTAYLADPVTRRAILVTINSATEESISSATITSDEVSSFTFALTYKSGKNTLAATSFSGDLELQISNSANVRKTAFSYDSETATGSFSLLGLSQTDAVTVSIVTSQDLAFSAQTKSITVSVDPKDVVLLTTFNDKWYVMQNTLSSGHFAPLEVIYIDDNGKVYYKPTVADIEDITWQTFRSGDDYVLKFNGNYLGAGTAGKLTLSSTPTLWGKDDTDEDRLSKEGGVGICITGDVFGSYMANAYSTNTAYSPSVIMVDVEDVASAIQYPRTLTEGNYATMCLPYSVSRSEMFFTGVDVFNISGKYMKGGNVVGIQLEEETGALTAGKPYVIQATASAMSVWHGTDSVSDPIPATGLVGNLSDESLIVPDSCYGIASNKLRMVNGGTGKVGKYKAYIDLSDVDEVTSEEASAPGRRVIYSTEATDTATSVEDFLNNGTEINWNEPVYNTLGQRVGKGATGVLLQYGKKFLVQ